MASYQYSPLGDDEIRLLTLSSRRSGSLRISIEIRKLSSSDRPQYDALSYAWGSTESPCTIAVTEIRNSDGLQRRSGTLRPRSGGSHNRDHFKISKTGRAAATSRQAPRTIRSTVSLAITRNLAEALPYLQFEDTKHILWIDAICINQKNLAERGEQVGRMADIYRMAHRVLIWLGPADRDSELALKTMAHLVAQVKFNFVTYAVNFVRDADSLFRETMPILPFDDVTMRALISLFERSWFERLWVWQETHTNSNDKIVLIGQHSLPWNTIRKFVISLQAIRVRMPTELAEPMNRAYLLSCDLVDLNLITSLLVTKYAKCTDARDWIFAVLGMLEPRNRLGIQPDYTKTVADVFEDVMLQYLAVVKRLDMLRYCKLTAKLVDMPSWVPDWSKISEVANEFSCASLSAHAEAEYGGKRTLRVSGVEAGAHFLTAIGVCPHGYDRDRPQDGDCDANPLLDALAEEREPPRPDLPSSENVMQSLLRWQEYLAKQRMDLGVCEPPPISSGDRIYRADVQKLATLYTPFQTMEGHFGLGPKSIIPGDKVCVVLGCDAPLILRPTSEDEWMIVGDCYVHGMMDGSALLSSCPTDFRLIMRMNPSNGNYSAAFRNFRTGIIQIEDPRITEPFPAGWEVMKHKDEQYQQLYVNKGQKLYTPRDPRLSPDALRARGVKLRTFKLV